MHLSPTEWEVIGGIASYAGLAVYNRAPVPGEAWTKARMYEWAYDVIGDLLNRPRKTFSQPAGPAQQKEG